MVGGPHDEAIGIFKSDHGYHPGENDFWLKISLRDVSARVPLIIYGPSKTSGVSDALVELLDLYPTTAQLCGLTRRRASMAAIFHRSTKGLL